MTVAAKGDDDLALVVVRAGTTEAAIEATHVLEVCPEAQWNGAEPIELGHGAAGPAAADADVRLIVVRRRSAEPVALRTRGAVRVKHIRRAAALAMPAILRLYVPWIAAVVIDGRELAIVIVDPDAIVAWAKSLR